jgi:hypothetical protein
MHRLKRKVKAAGGYGIVLLLVFLASTVLIGASLQLVGGPTMDRMEGQASREYASAQQLASTGMLAVRSDILADLDASTTVDTSYRYPGASPAVTNVTAYRDPANYAAGSDVVGSYYGTVTYASGDTYVIKVTATVGDSTFSKSELFHLGVTTAPAPPVFTCSGIEDDIAAGSIASITSADLQTYAQNGCMTQTVTPPAAPPAGAGSTACGNGGPGTINLAQISAACSIAGTWDTLQLKSTTSDSSTSAFTSTSATARTINIPGAWSSTADLILAGAGDQTVLFGTATPTNMEITASTGNDTLRLGGTFTKTITGGSLSTYNVIDLGAGNNTLYAKSLAVTANAATPVENGIITTTNFTAASSTGTNHFYVDNLPVTTTKGASHGAISTVNFTGGSGDDYFICNAGFGSVCAISATGTGDSKLTIDMGAGNNIININGTVTESGGQLGAFAKIYGGSATGYNIIYVKACSGTITISPGPAAGGNGSGNNLIIIPTLTNCTISGTTANDVLLYKTGTTAATFARKLVY